MKIINVPFKFNTEDFNRRIKIELYQGMEDEIEDLLEKVIPLVSPKAIFIESKIEPSKTKVVVGTQTFDDEVLLARVQKNSVIFPYIVTCGTELENLEDYKDDMLADFWLDAIKQMALDSAFNFLRAELKDSYNLKKIYSLNPGSDSCGEGWEFSDQKKLFNLFPTVTEDIGVTLADSLLMYPNKTLSGIMFESDKDFVSCQECPNVNCQNRRKIHDGAIM